MPLFETRDVYVAIATEQQDMEKDIAEQSHCLERPKEQRRIGILSIASVREKVARLPTAGILMTLICLLLVLDISVRYPTSAGYCSRKLSLPSEYRGN